MPCHRKVTKIDTPPSRTQLVTVDSSGCFQAECFGQRIKFRDGSGQPLTLASVPSGSWPILYDRSGDDALLYFTYFLSGRLHKWLLDEAGGRKHGVHADAGEVAALLQGLQGSGQAAAAVAHLLRKIEHRVILVPGRTPAAGAGIFHDFEQTVAAAYLQKRHGHPAPASLLHGFAVAADLSLDRLLHLTKVPSGYEDPLSLSDGETDVPSPPANMMIAELDSAPLTRVLTELIEPLNRSLSQHARPFQLGMFLDLPIETIEVTAVVAELGGGPALARIDLGFSRELINPATPKDGQFRRISSTLQLLHPFISEIADRQPRTGSLRLAVSDGGGSGAADVVAFDRHHGSPSPLMPDLYVLHETQTPRYVPRLSAQEFRQAFAAKRPTLFWRGTTTGHADGRTLEQFKQNYRVRACLLVNDMLGPCGDARISHVHGVLPDVRAEAEAYLDSHGIRAPLVPEHTFGLYQVYLDLPGNAAAWGSYRKYLMGCLVVRPDSGRELLYYRLQKPWVHFIPAAPDLADLGRIMDWIIAHPIEAAGIAHAGRQGIIEYLSDVPHHIRAALETAMTHEVP